MNSTASDPEPPAEPDPAPPPDQETSAGEQEVPPVPAKPDRPDD